LKFQDNWSWRLKSLFNNLAQYQPAIMKNWIGLTTLFLTISIAQGHDLIYFCQQYNLTTFLDLLNSAGLTATLSAADGVTTPQYTLFAPTNQAFANLQATDQAAYNALLADRSLLVNVLSYHVSSGSHPTSSLADNSVLVMLNGQVAKINSFTGTLPGYTTTVYTINNAILIVVDIMASNGVLHIIDKVLVPPTLDVSGAVSLAGLSIFNTALAASGIQLDPNVNYTYLVPTNAAFEALGTNLQSLLLPENQALLAGVLNNHIIRGIHFSNELIENGVTVTTLSGVVLDFNWDASSNRIILAGTSISIVVADILALNGVIQVIDGVIGSSAIVIPTSQTVIPTSQTVIATSRVEVPTSQPVIATSNQPQVVPVPVPVPIPTSEPAVVPTFVPTVSTSQVVTTQPAAPATTGIILLPPGAVSSASLAGPIVFLVGLVVLAM